MCALILQACASAPFDLGAAPQAPPVMASQQELRTAAATLVATVREQDWQLADTRGAGAFSLLGRLVGGTPEGDDLEAQPDPVLAYLDRHEGEAASQLRADIRLAAALTGEVVELAGRVAASERELERAAIDRDIAETEAALTAARKANAFFASAHAELQARDPLDPHTVLADALGRLEQRVDALAASADALADRRWGRPPGAMS